MSILSIGLLLISISETSYNCEESVEVKANNGVIEVTVGVSICKFYSRKVSFVFKLRIHVLPNSDGAANTWAEYLSLILTHFARM